MWGGVGYVPGFLASSHGKESACSAGDLGSIPVLGRSLEEDMAAQCSILPGESHGERSLAGCSPRGPKELDTTERLGTEHTQAVYQAHMVTFGFLMAGSFVCFL